MKITATERKEQGTSASRRLRRAGSVPGIIYGQGEAMSITIDHNQLWHAMRKEGALTSIVEVDVKGKTTPTVVRDIHYHAYKPFITHIDFQRVDMKKTLVMSVPVHYLNAEESPAVKTEGQVINHIITELEIECLPGNLPDSIIVDLIGLEAGGSVHLSSVTLPKGVSLTHAISEDDDPVLVTAARVAEESTEDVEAAGEGAEAAEGETATKDDDSAPAQEAEAKEE